MDKDLQPRSILKNVAADIALPIALCGFTARLQIFSSNVIIANLTT